MRDLTIKTIEQDFPNQWLLIEVTETKDGAPFRGVLLKASKKRQIIVEAIAAHKNKKLSFLFSGVHASPNTAFAVSCLPAHCDETPEQLSIGSDYGHNDPAEEKALVQTMRSREDLSPTLVEKIFSDNPK